MTGFGTPPGASQASVNALAARVSALESGQGGSGATQVYVQESAPAQGAAAWVWFKPSTETTSYYAPGSPTAPTFTGNPAITGTALVGSTLTCDGGTVTGAATIVKTYQWTRGGADIAGATASTHVVASGDVGNALRCVVTAVNGVSPDATGTSNAITPAVPLNTIAPAITGSAITGQTLTGTTGTWTSAGSPTYARQWQRDGTDIAGATASTYVLVSGDEGHVIRQRVIATDANGASSAVYSNTLTPSASATAPGAPTSLALTPGDGQIAAAWTAPASNGGSAITTYLVEYRTPNGSGSYTTFAHSASTTPSITITGLTNGSAYGVRVSAVNAIGTGTATSEATATPVSAAAQTPTQIFGADFVAQWDPADIALSGGAAVPTWPSTGAAAAFAQSTSGKRPTLQTSQINGLSVVRFDGTDDSMTVTLATPVPIPYVIGLVFKVRTLTPSGLARVALGTDSNVLVKLSSVNGSGLVDVDWDNNQHVIYGNSTSPGAYHAWLFAADGTNGTVYLDGTIPAGGSGAQSTTKTLSTITIAADKTDASPADMDLAGMFIAKRVPTGGDLTALGAYFAGKWAL